MIQTMTNIKNDGFFRKLYYLVDPIDSEIAGNLRLKLNDVYTEIKSKAYFVTNDMIKIKTHQEDKNPFKLYHVPASLIVAHLINRSSTLLEGSPGCGKTKIAKIVSRMMTGSSINGANNIIYCDDELSKDKWMAFPDVKKMMADASGNRDDAGGSFDVIWSSFFNDSKDGIDLIIDEINRANPKTQNELLSLMAEGIVQYAVPARKKIKEFRLFFTQNPLDEIMKSGAIYPLSLAFKDRITQFIRVSQPPMYAMKRVSEVRKDERNYEFNEDEDVKVLMTVKEIQTATVLASKMPVTENAKKYAMYMVRDTNLCMKAPLHDKTQAKELKIGGGLCKGCHFAEISKYHCDKFYGGSMRMYKDLIAVGKAYAFWLGLDEVNEFLINSIALDVIGHRVLILPKPLRNDHVFSGNSMGYLKRYLVDWCFNLLHERKNPEEAFNRLYYGKSRNTEEDINTIIMAAQNDLYVRIDLMPKVIETNLDHKHNLKEGRLKVLSSTATPEYENFAMSIEQIMEENAWKEEKKMDELNNLSKKITGIDFSSNLIDMIYSKYPALENSMKMKAIKKKEG